MKTTVVQVDTVVTGQACGAVRANSVADVTVAVTLERSGQVWFRLTVLAMTSVMMMLCGVDCGVPVLGAVSVRVRVPLQVPTKGGA